MGEYLRRQYEERDLAIALAKVHGLIDDENEKLCDELKKYKKSYKQLEVLVRKFDQFLRKWRLEDEFENDEEFLNDLDFLKDRISRRLNYW